MLAQAGGCVESIAVKTVCGPLRTDKCTGYPPRTETYLQFKSFPRASHSTGRDALQGVGELDHSDCVGWRVSFRLLSGVSSSTRSARAGDDIPLTDVLVLAHARGCNRIVEIRDQIVHVVESFIGESGKDLLLLL